MIFTCKPVRDWFGHTRGERSANIVLLFLIAGILLVRYMIPERKVTVTDVTMIWQDSAYSSGGRVTGYSGPEEGKSITIRETAGAIKSMKAGSKTNKVGRPESQTNSRQPILNINTCDSGSLVALPGIGPVLSARIIKYRNLLGGFASVEQLREVYGLPEETFITICGRLYADSSEVRKIQINSADFKTLIRIPYVERYEVNAILKYRQLKGSLKGIDDLTINNLVDSTKATKMRPYLQF